MNLTAKQAWLLPMHLEAVSCYKNLFPPVIQIQIVTESLYQSAFYPDDGDGSDESWCRQNIYLAKLNI